MRQIGSVLPQAILLGELGDASDAAVHRTLETDLDTAGALVFDLADVPDQSYALACARQPLCRAGADD